MPDHAPAPVRQPLALHCSQERFSLRLDGLGQQATGAASQDRRQRIVDRLGLTEGNNTGSAHLGVSLLREVQAGFHPPRYAAFLIQPSPILRHSSINGLYETEVIRRRGPWRSLEAVEFATLEWVEWFNDRRLLEPIGNIPPAEAEARYYEQIETLATAA